MAEQSQISSLIIREKRGIYLFFEYMATMKEHCLIHTFYKRGIDKTLAVAFASLILALSDNQKK
ncbi:hypothetical protein [Oceanobacillus sojae]|uniref:hypothetical protein n=1 Tax=Oceanobacillus sojae TaxID=582851 RepID=UPI003629E49E